MTWTEAQKRYASSSLGKLSRKKYQESEKGRAKHKEYLARRREKLAKAKQLKTEINYAPVKEKLTETKKEVKSKK